MTEVMVISDGTGFDKYSIFLAVFLGIVGLWIALEAVSGIVTVKKDITYIEELLQTENWLKDEFEKVKVINDYHKINKQYFKKNDSDYDKKFIIAGVICIIIFFIALCLRVLISVLFSDCLYISFGEVGSYIIFMIISWGILYLYAFYRLRKRYKMKLRKNKKHIVGKIWMFLLIGSLVCGVSGVIFERTVVKSTGIIEYNYFNNVENEVLFTDAVNIRCAIYKEYSRYGDRYMLNYVIYFNDGSCYYLNVSDFLDIASLEKIDNILSEVPKEYLEDSDIEELEDMRDMNDDYYSDTEWDMLESIFIEEN